MMLLFQLPFGPFTAVRSQRNLLVLGSYCIYCIADSFILRLLAGHSYYSLILTHLLRNCHTQRQVDWCSAGENSASGSAGSCSHLDAASNERNSSSCVPHVIHLLFDEQINTGQSAVLAVSIYLSN